MNELQAGMEFTLAVFPQPSILLQPGKTALHHPTLGDNGRGMQFTALGNLYLYCTCTPRISCTPCAKGWPT